jgi:uncharacterized damage-inducible protein DinB
MKMNSDYFRLLIDFHYWARDRALAAVEMLTAEQYAKPMGRSFSSIRDTLNHIYGAEWVWYSRWNGVSPTSFPLDELSELGMLRAKWSELEGKVRAYVDATDEDGMNRVIEYRLMSGTPGASPLWQMVVHVVNHATYHRGQVTTLLRQHNAMPSKSTDMITFFREMPAAAKA